jgi:hypothetical protein
MNGNDVGKGSPRHVHFIMIKHTDYPALPLQTLCAMLQCSRPDCMCAHLWAIGEGLGLFAASKFIDCCRSSLVGGMGGVVPLYVTLNPKVDAYGKKLASARFGLAQPVMWGELRFQ